MEPQELLFRLGLFCIGWKLGDMLKWAAKAAYAHFKKSS